MPIYEYKCENCGTGYEQIRRMSDADSNLACPDCSSTSVQRQLSSFAAHGGSSPAESMPSGGCGMNGCGPTGCGWKQ
ncbi:MAG: zinc ribbon domain-containing protein [Bryobacteraceae bacterium]